MRRNCSSRFGGKRIGLALCAQILAGIFGVDFEEVVEDYHKHSCATQEDGQRVERIVGDHIVDRGSRGLGDLEVSICVIIPDRFENVECAGLLVLWTSNGAHWKTE